MSIALYHAPARAETTTATATADSKIVQLEALRGLAAFVVVAWHFLWAFDPARIGIVDGFDPSAALLGSVSFASIDGPAAVVLFFVLSGFVLPLGFSRGGNTTLVVRAATNCASSARSCSPCCSLICYSAAASTGIARRHNSLTPRGSVRSEAHIRHMNSGRR